MAEDDLAIEDLQRLAARVSDGAERTGARLMASVVRKIGEPSDYSATTTFISDLGVALFATTRLPLTIHSASFMTTLRSLLDNYLVGCASLVLHEIAHTVLNGAAAAADYTHKLTGPAAQCRRYKQMEYEILAKAALLHTVAEYMTAGYGVDRNVLQRCLAAPDTWTGQVDGLKGVIVPGGSAAASQPKPHLASVTTRPQTNPRRGPGPAPPKKKNGAKCFVCREVGHRAADCPLVKRD